MSFFLLKRRPLIFGHVSDGGVRGPLQHAEVRDDGPAVRGYYLIFVRRHGAPAIGDDGEDVSVGQFDHPVFKEIGRLPLRRVRRYDAVTGAGTVMARNTIRVEAELA